MERQSVTLFRPYTFVLGQKIHIESGPRKGDWEVVGLTGRKVKLQCPISHRVLEWNRFCYHVMDLDEAQWPRQAETELPDE